MLHSRSKRLRQIAGVLETASFLSLKLLWKRPDRMRVFPGIVFRNYLGLVGNDGWSSGDIFDRIPELRENPPRIILQPLPGEGIETPVDELAYLALLTAALRPKMVFEFGTFRGRTALHFALNSPPDCRVFTLDLPPDERSEVLARVNPADAAIIRASETGKDCRDSDVSHKIEQLYGDSTRFDFRPFYGQVDLAFVDGGHDYEVARSDSRNAVAMTRPGGLVVWHDFGNYGAYYDVVRAVFDEVPRAEVWQVAGTQLAVYRKPDSL
jgi:predicted O-methyltransferase YrrM